MTIKNIYLNLPIKDLSKTRAFWEGVGFAINEDFSDERAICVVLKPDLIYAMLITYEMFETFTHRPIADGKSTQVLIAIEVENKSDVDDIVNKAVASGGKRYLQAVDEGWMYYDRFEDLDGHQWEVMFSDLSQMPQA